MLSAAPKDLRENLARANGYLRRNEVERALAAMSAALRRYTEVRLTRAARAGLDAQINEFLHDLARHPAMRTLLDPRQSGAVQSIPYRPGQAGTLCTVLEGLARILRQEAQSSMRQEVQSRLERKKNLIQTGLRFLREGQTALGSAFLKRVAEECSEEEGICLQLGQIFAAAGQYADAAEMYEQAMQNRPREAAAYTGAVDAWLKLREFARAENVCKAVLRVFGGHPATYGKMARLYLDWGKPQAAEDFARRALQEDPAQTDGLAVLAALRRD
ncbi:tetratricopeptide repeat protein [Desulfovibrio sp. ZJ369]|uniref:tetratricopeptide repeat protein n=1 Tax=Desulfovibrio sp. ZJ369 TaxID=2709793 RepID=UPI0013EB93B8|nr:tetratricopeptide repeat protein [Desulfovibrio sp. ZJ369]